MSIPMRLRLALTIALCCSASLAQAQTSASDPAAASQTRPDTRDPVWTWHPSVSLLGSLDENHDALTGTDPARFEEAELAGNIGTSLAGGAVLPAMRFDYDLFGLARSPVSGTMRSLYVGGRVNWSWQFAHDWHLSASDSAKLQRQPSLPVAAFQRNEATVGLDWHPVHAPASWSLEFSDRRRALPSLEILEFHRRSLTLTASASRESSAASIGVSVQPYRAETATGTFARLAPSKEAIRLEHLDLGDLRRRTA